jgi:hypothetical protein
MNANPIEPLTVMSEARVSIVDMEELTGRIWRNLHGTVDPARTRQVLVDLLPKYQEARILTFDPILTQRDAIEILRH